MWNRFVISFAFILRVFLYLACLDVIHSSFAISTPLNSMMLTLVFGQALGLGVAFSRLKSWVIPALLAGGFLGIQLLFGLSELVETTTPQSILSPYSLLLDSNLLAFTLAVAFLSSWLYWRVNHFATLEALVLLLSVLAFFAPHRDLQLSRAPQIVQLLAWELHTSSFALIIILGGLATLLLITYLGVSSHALRPSSEDFQAHPPIVVGGGIKPIALAISVLSLLLIVGLTTRQVYSHFYTLSQSAGANGVGFQESEEALGRSPLGFHSALGSNNQPAGLVRLEGDYRENPFSPMLYLREGALSKYNGKEIVNAGKAFDDDVTYSKPNEVYLTSERLDLFNRIPLTQSIYLLSQHDVSFAVDYPLSIQPLENPAPQRFTAVFKAYSIAPTYTVGELSLADTGDPDWTKEKRAHYLETHSDLRYGELAVKITEGITDPAEQGKALIEHLSKNSIYTLTPKHEVEPDEDPVAPYLFGDLRGYCVHFAHATVYMLRSLGIPARIATGYLTDLSQAKDGHILLRMSDRHAWAEAYFAGYGWVPFDTHPDQVESHADTEVDQNLLEELMGLVGNEKELLPPEPYEEEPGLEQPAKWELPSVRFFVTGLGALFLLFILIKIFLWYGWLLPGSTLLATTRGSSAIRARLIDLGLIRRHGETSQEYFKRLGEVSSITPDHTWEVFRLAKYAQIVPERDALRHAISSDMSSIEELPFSRRFLAFFNPASVFRRV